MSSIAKKRCYNHATREAAARCPECGRFFCRECITEHKGRVLCATCLERQDVQAGNASSLTGKFFRFVFCGMGFLLLWFVFFYLGKILTFIPSSFHEGTIWKLFTP